MRPAAGIGRSVAMRSRARAPRPARTRRRSTRCGRGQGRRLLVEEIVELRQRRFVGTAGLLPSEPVPGETRRAGHRVRPAGQHRGELAVGVEVGEQAAEIALVGAETVDPRCFNRTEFRTTTFVINAMPLRLWGRARYAVARGAEPCVRSRRRWRIANASGSRVCAAATSARCVNACGKFERPAALGD